MTVPPEAAVPRPERWRLPETVVAPELLAQPVTISIVTADSASQRRTVGLVAIGCSSWVPGQPALSMAELRMPPAPV